MIRVFIADDHEVVRAGLRSLITTDPEFAVVGEAATGAETVEKVLKTIPDVLVLDVSMPNESGMEITEQIKQAHPIIKILVLSVHDDREYLRTLLKAGVSGYALKRSAAAELPRAIRAVALGETYIDPSLAGEFVKTVIRPMSDTVAPNALSDRESKVLRAVADGYSTKEIAAMLTISAKTVETYKTRGMEKLGVTSRVGIVEHASNNAGLIGDQVIVAAMQSLASHNTPVSGAGALVVPSAAFLQSLTRSQRLEELTPNMPFCAKLGPTPRIRIRAGVLPLITKPTIIAPSP